MFRKKSFLVALISLLLAGCGFNVVSHRSDKPVSRQAASKDISLPFPLSTRDVYYVFHSAGVHDLQFFTRFTVASNDVWLCVSNILDDRDTKMHAESCYTTNPIAGAPPSPVFTNLAPMTWWHPEAITNGHYLTTTNGQPFQIWLDSETHTFYLCIHN